MNLNFELRHEYQVEIYNQSSGARQYFIFYLKTSDPMEAMALLSQAKPIRECIEGGRKDEKKAISRFQGPGQQTLVEL